MTTPGSHHLPTTSPYGAPPVATARPGSSDATVWAVRIAAGLIALGGVPLMLGGLVLMAADLEQSGEMFDGLGAMIGLAVCAVVTRERRPASGLFFSSASEQPQHVPLFANARAAPST